MVTVCQGTEALSGFLGADPEENLFTRFDAVARSARAEFELSGHPFDGSLLSAHGFADLGDGRAQLVADCPIL